MAETFLGPFSVPGMDSQQTAVAVQSLLESQTLGETTPVDEDDVFQCGKCKKQFTSLAAFLNHKQSRCVAQKTLQQINNNTNANNGSVSTTALLQPATKGPQIIQTSLPAYSAVTPSLTQLPQSMVLTDDIMSFANVDQTLGASTIQLQGATLQPAGPFLSQVATFTSRSPNNVTILSPVNTSATLPSSGSAFTSTVSANQIQLQSVPHQITLTAIPEKPIAPNVGNIAKPSPTKAGRKSAQASIVTVVSADNASIVKLKRGKNGNLVVDDKKKLHCNYCDKAFAKNFDLQQHIRAHTGEKPFQCIVCGRAFAQKSNVKKHMSTHKVWPSGAGSTLPTQPLPVIVEETAPPSDNAQPTGDNSTLTESNLSTVVQAIPQMSPGTENSPVVVEDVGTGETITITSAHNVDMPAEPLPQENSTNEDGNNSDSKLKVMVDNSYLCQYCSAKFRTYFQLKTHMVQHKNEQVYKCVMKDCTGTFKELDTFLEHIKAHEEEMTYRCHMCNKFFPSLYELGLHQYSHSLYPNQGIKPGPRHFQCTKCMNKYSTPEALEHHLTTSTHKHPCPHCKKTFTCERYLRRHLPSHGSEGQFQCPTCNKRFKGEHYLKMHLLIHSGEKPFPCDICDAAFNRKDKLKRHMLIHDSTKRYKCPFKTLTGCQKEFNRPDKLKSHIITHSGIKPYKCRECGRAFGRKPHLKEHERGHRADFKYKCEACGKGFFRPKLFQSHKCQPMRLGQVHVFRPRVRRKVGRPKKRVPLESVELVEGVRVENCMTAVGKIDKLSGRSEEGDNSQSDIMDEDNTEGAHCSVLGVAEGGVIGLETGSALEKANIAAEKSHRTKTATPVKPKPEFCVKVSAPPPPHAVTPRFVTVHIQNPNSGSTSEIQTVHIQSPNSANTSDIQTHLLPSGSSRQILTTQGETGAALQPITIIEAQPVHINCSMPVVSGMENSSGETITVQMAAVNSTAAGDRISESMATMGSVVGELVPVAVAMQDSSDSLVTTQVVVTSAGSTDQSYITCTGQLDDFGPTDTDAVLQGSKSRNFIQNQTDFF